MEGDDRTAARLRIGAVRYLNSRPLTLTLPADPDLEVIFDLPSRLAEGLKAGTLDVALKRVSKERADLGSYQNRLEHAIKGIDVGAENTQAAESRIRDVDMASEMVNYTKDRILAQAGNAMLAQANQKNQQVLQLLQ